MTGVWLVILFLAWILPVQGAIVTMTINVREKNFGADWLSRPAGIASCWLVAIYVLTLAVGIGLFNGDRLSTFCGGFIAMGIAIPWIMFAKLIPAWRQTTWHRPKWYEWLLLAFLIEKVFFAIWQFNNIPVYFEDPLFHWVTRGRELYAGVNWSWNPTSDVFLGPTDWNRHYPLCLPILRAILAEYNGQFNDTLARIDGLIFFVLIATILWSTAYRVTNSRPLAAFAVFAWQTLPLLPWHIAGGNADLALSAFLIGAVAAMLERRFFLTGLLVAGAAWCKNDGLVLVNLSVIAGIIAVLSDQQVLTKNATLKRIQTVYFPSLLRYLAGFLTLLPWLAFRQFHQLGLSPNKEEFGLHVNAIASMATDMFLAPTSGLFWLATLGVTSPVIWLLFKDSSSRSLWTVTATYLFLIIAIFTFTDAHRWLQNDITFHRLLLQLSPVAAMLLTVSLSKMIPMSEPTAQSTKPS
jgi:hypothetical protein